MRLFAAGRMEKSRINIKESPYKGHWIDAGIPKSSQKTWVFAKQMLALGWDQDHRSPAEFSKLWRLSE